MFITEYITVLETNLTLILRKRKVKQIQINGKHPD